MFLSWDLDIKLCQNYTKKFIFKLYVRITWPELRPMAVQYTGHVIPTETRDSNTTLPLAGVWWHVPDAEIISSILSIIDEKLLNSYNKRSKLKFLRLFWDIVVFRLVAYLLNMISLILRILYKILHMYDVRFGIILTQFYVNFSRQEHKIKLLYVSIT